MGHDRTVSFTLDTNLCMIKENPEGHPSCAIAGRWCVASRVAAWQGNALGAFFACLAQSAAVLRGADCAVVPGKQASRTCHRGHPEGAVCAPGEPPALPARCRYRDPTLPIHRTEITRFPHAILEIKLALPEGQQPPEWVRDLMDSGLITEVGDAPLGPPGWQGRHR